MCPKGKDPKIIWEWMTVIPFNFQNKFEDFMDNLCFLDIPDLMVHFSKIKEGCTREKGRRDCHSILEIPVM